MTRNQEVIALSKLDYSYSQIAERFNISKQRVHQIVTGYQSYAAQRQKYEVYTTINLQRCCQRCKSKKRLEVHHIDGDSSNNTIENLIKLCSFCHHQFHLCFK